MKILDVIIKLSMVIFELMKQLSFSIGNRIINNLEELEVPLIETLNKYFNLSTETLKSMVGILGVFLGVWMAKSIRKRLIKASQAAKRIKYRMSGSHYDGKSHYGFSSPGMARDNGNFSQGWDKHHNNINKQGLIFDQMQDGHLNSHEQFMADHQNFMDNFNNELFMNDSMNNCMEDAFNAATPCDFGGDSQSIFESSFDNDLNHDFDNSFDHDFDSGFDHDFDHGFNDSFDHGSNHDFGGFHDF